MAFYKKAVHEAENDGLLRRYGASLSPVPVPKETPKKNIDKRDKSRQQVTVGSYLHQMKEGTQPLITQLERNVSSSLHPRR